MGRVPLLWKLFAAYVALVLLVSSATAWVVRDKARANALRQHERSLRFTAELLRDVAQPALAADAPARLQEALARRLATLSDDSAVRLTVIRADGTVLADSDEDPARMQNHGDRPEVRQALATGLGRASRESATLRRSFLYVALPVGERERPAGVARAAISLSDLEAELRELTRVISFGALLAILFGLGAGAYFARRLSSSLDKMAQVAEAITRGDHDAARPYGSSEELGRLAGALDAMSIKLREHLAGIEGDRNKVLAILGSMVEGVVAVDKEQRVVHINQVAGRLLRIAPHVAEQRRIWELTRVVEVREILESALRAGGEIRGEARLPAEPGSRVGAASGRALELRASPMRDASGAVAGAVVVLHDVTELRRLEAVRSDFVANVSHELKTPLTAIRGLVETLLDDAEMAADTRQRFLGKVLDQSRRLSSLVGDLLTLARIESQEAAAEARVLDLRGPVRDCAARFSQACEPKGIRLALELPDEPASVLADDESLRQILDNLTDNAVKYTPPGGRIWLAVRMADPAEDEPRVVLEVRDTGIGIEPRDLERVFERFYRVDKARSRELGGTGLGLSIVKHLALSLGGRVSVESAPGRGSAFRVHLPAADLAS